MKCGSMKPEHDPPVGLDVVAVQEHLVAVLADAGARQRRADRGRRDSRCGIVAAIDSPTIAPSSAGVLSPGASRCR